MLSTSCWRLRVWGSEAENIQTIDEITVCGKNCMFTNLIIRGQLFVKYHGNWMTSGRGIYEGQNILHHDRQLFGILDGNGQPGRYRCRRKNSKTCVKIPGGMWTLDWLRIGPSVIFLVMQLNRRNGISVLAQTLPDLRNFRHAQFYKH